jgi:hypothetical protein
MPLNNPDTKTHTITKKNNRWLVFIPWIGLIILLLLVLISYLVFVDCSTSIGRRSCTRVLFIGNSFTSVNDLPGTFAKLAKSGGHKVEVGMSAPGGWTLQQHASSSDTLNLLIGSKWDYVSLQEQSQIPSLAGDRESIMYPAVRILATRIKENGAQPVLFLTWAHKDGWPENGMSNYEVMQSNVIQGYLSIANELHAKVAPVGYTWLMELRQNPLMNLWQADGIHPTEAGTYLAACVFYATLFHESPVGLSYHGSLSSETTVELQRIAVKTVLEKSDLWGIN